MATKHQIMLVKTIHRRLKELLGDNKVTVTVSYTSASDILRITFKKVLKGAAFELPICSSLKVYTLNPEILQYIVTDALEKMPKPPKWESMSTLFTELRRRRDDYQQYVNRLPSPHYEDAYFSAVFSSQQDATVALYDIGASTHARAMRCMTSDLDLFESSFERDAGLASGGEYTRWREAGEPKRWTDPVDSLRALANPDNGVAPVMGIVTHNVSRVSTWDGMVAAFGHGGAVPAIGASWNSHAPLPDTLFGLPIIWADESPSTQEPTNEQA